MTREIFNLRINPVLNTRFRASKWARESDRVKYNHYARWYTCLIDKFSNHRASFEEITDAMEIQLRGIQSRGFYGQYSYFLALTQTPYYKYRIIHTKVKLCHDQTT